MRVVRALGTLAMVVVIALAIAFAALSLLSRGEPTNRSSWVGGYKPFVVLSGSMEPHVGVGSVLLSRRVDPARVRVGDVITFITPQEAETGSLRPGTITTHRVVSIKKVAGGQRAFSTQGDANEGADPWPIPSESVLGREVLTVPYMGYVSRFASTRTGLLTLVIVPAVLLMLVEVATLVRRGREVSSQEAQERL